MASLAHGSARGLGAEGQLVVRGPFAQVGHLSTGREGPVALCPSPNLPDARRRSTGWLLLALTAQLQMRSYWKATEAPDKAS